MNRFAKVRLTRGQVRKIAGVSGVALGAAATGAHAAVDISSTITSTLADVASAGGLIMGVVVAVAAFAWIRKVIH